MYGIVSTINESESDFRIACCSGSTIYIIINTMEMTISCTDADDSDNSDNSHNNGHQHNMAYLFRYAICRKRHYTQNEIYIV